MWVIVRPKPKLQKSLQFFQAQGIELLGYSPMDIVTCSRDLKKLQSALLQSELPDGLIVTSTEAANRLADLIVEHEHLSLPCYCIGQSTYDVLKETSLDCHIPNQQDSEGMLAMPHMHDVSGLRFALIKGQGGRTLLRKTLQSRGAEIKEYAVYHRQILTIPVMSEPIDWSVVKGVMVTSQALLDAMIHHEGIESLQTKVFVGVSERICRYGKSLGLEEFYSSHGATDAHLLGWLNRQGRGQI